MTEPNNVITIDDREFVIAEPNALHLVRLLAVIGKVGTRVMSGGFDLRSMAGLRPGAVNYKGRFTSVLDQYGRSYTRTEIDGLFAIERGTDGDRCWVKRTSQKGRLLEGEERSVRLLESHIEPNLKELYREVECLGTEEIGGRPCFRCWSSGMDVIGGRECYKVLMRPWEGPPVAAYFDRQSGLLMSFVRAFERNMGGPIKEQVRYELYRRVDGLLLPHRITVEGTAQTILGERRSKAVFEVQYEHNRVVREERFEMPAEKAGR